MTKSLERGDLREQLGKLGADPSPSWVLHLPFGWSLGD